MYGVRRVCLHVTSPLVFSPPGKAGHVYPVGRILLDLNLKLLRSARPGSLLTLFCSLCLCGSVSQSERKWDSVAERARLLPLHVSTVEVLRVFGTASVTRQVKSLRSASVAE